MTQVVLVRHGETVWHAENRYAGHSDIELTPRGHEQARHLAEWAALAELDAVWCSSLSRARETASRAAAAAGCEPRVDQRLRELHFGRAEGLTTGDMQRDFPAALEAFRSDPVSDHLPEGEDPHAAVARGMDCLREIAAIHPQGRVLVVSHTTLIRLLLCHVIGVPIGAYRQLFPFVRNVAITEIRLDDDRASLLQFNTPLGPGAAAAPPEPAPNALRPGSV